MPAEPNTAFWQQVFLTSYAKDYNIKQAASLADDAQAALERRFPEYTPPVPRALPVPMAGKAGVTEYLGGLKFQLDAIHKCLLQKTQPGEAPGIHAESVLWERLRAIKGLVEQADEDWNKAVKVTKHP